MESCRMCKKGTGEYEIKGGRICQSCLERMPWSVQRNLYKFTKRQLAQLDRQMCSVKPQMQFFDGAFGIGHQEISINGRGFSLANLKRISLNFHPWAAGGYPDTVIGRVTVMAELKKPHILLEEPLLSEDIMVSYRITGKKITYSYPHLLEVIFGLLQECLEEKACDTASYVAKVRSSMEEYGRKWKEAERKEEAKKRAEDAKRREEAKKRAEEAKRKEEAKKRAENARRKEEESKRAKEAEKKRTPLEEARELFQLEKSYTEEELRKKRNMLLKQYHPDAGGSEEMTKKINKAYDILRQ